MRPKTRWIPGPAMTAGPVRTAPAGPAAGTGHAAVAVAAAVTVALTACGDPWPHEATFIERLGSDTIAVETLRWADDRYEGTVLVRSPETRMLDYWGVKSAGEMLEYGFQWRSPTAGPETPPLSNGTITWSGDSADVTLRDEDGVRTERVWAPPRTVPLPGRIPPPPLVAYSPVGAWREIVERLGASDDPLHLLGLGAGTTPETVTRPTTRWDDDSIGVRVISGWTVGRLDGSGELASISGHGTTIAIDLVPATAPVDLPALAREYAGRDERGEGFGVPSPPARVEAEVGGARLVVTYSRPARRGREIWGGLVPYGQIWRTGANVATHFETDRDLRLGDTAIPAGRYTLWTRVERDGVELIVNEQTGIWGTQYDTTGDLARIPMTRTSLDEPVERFTIEIAGRASGGDAGGAGGTADGVLSLAWARTRFSVPIRVP